MSGNRPIVSVITGGNARGRTHSERQVGTLKPVSDGYHVISLTGYVEARVYRGASLDWRVVTGDPYDMDSESETLPNGYATLGDAVTAVARMLLIPRMECTTYVKLSSRD